ncbi:TPA: electron transfer flavoprotein beta subunit/FixA family protein [Candidatus Bathyarchaeota archaeon]|nr:electron transfer flavoprotein beta subunit/FixA family protein [Candidatus Bathyarchaeota archaeon]
MKSKLHIIVLVKQVPDIEKVKFDVKTGRLDRRSAKGITNPFDLNALEVAVQIKEKLGGKVTAVSMGPPQAESTLRDCLARGADKAILLTDREFAGADTLATAYTLSCAIKLLKSFDLIVCGEKTLDGDTAQVGPEVAEFLKIPHVSYVDRIVAFNYGSIIVESDIGKFRYQYRLEYPCLITVTKDVNVPRLPTLRDKIKARKTEIEVWNAKMLEKVAEPDRFGLNGSPTRVMKVFTPSTTGRKGLIFEGEAEDLAERLFMILREAEAI